MTQMEVNGETAKMNKQCEVRRLSTTENEREKGYRYLYMFLSISMKQDRKSQDRQRAGWAVGCL